MKLTTKTNDATPIMMPAHPIAAISSAKRPPALGTRKREARSFSKVVSKAILPATPAS
jgi:hypothetical protein